MERRRLLTALAAILLCGSRCAATRLRNGSLAVASPPSVAPGNVLRPSVLNSVADDQGVAVANCSAPDDFLAHVHSFRGDIGFIQTSQFAIYSVDTGIDMSLFAYDCVKKKRLLFIHIPKNAGTTIEKVGQKNFMNMRWGLYTLSGQQRMPDGNKCNQWHVPPSQLKGFNPYLGQDAEVFCVTRDPWERVLSEYIYQVEVGWKWQSFRRFSRSGPLCTEVGLNNFILNSVAAMEGGERWIADCHMLPQWEYIRGPTGYEWCNHKLSIDKLTPEFNALMADRRIPLRMEPHHKHNTATECPKLKDAAARDPHAVFGKATQAAMRRMYMVDFENLGDSLK